MSKIYVSFPLWGGIRLIRAGGCATTCLLLLSIPAVWIGLIWFVLTSGSGFLHGVARALLWMLIAMLPLFVLMTWHVTYLIIETERMRRAREAALHSRTRGYLTIKGP